MQSLERIIGGSVESIKNIRVANATKAIQTESYMKLEKMKQNYRNLQNDLENALDLGITNTQDVATNVKNINAEELIEKVNNLAQEMLIAAREIKLAVKVHNTLFPSNPQSDLTIDEIDFLEGCL
jgi:hypothetical protein